MQRAISTLIMFFCGLCIHALCPPWLVDFREAVYGQNISIAAAQRMFNEAEKKTRENLEEADLYSALSHCHYFLGRVYQDHGQNKEAIARFEEGVSLAERSLAKRPTARGYEMLSSNLGELCKLKSNTWVMTNGLKVLDNAEKALQLDSKNAMAMYVLASQWAFGPGAFGNPKRGITELQSILDSQANLEKNDYFNVYSALAYAHNRLNQNDEALLWIDRALFLYPTNKFALDLKEQIEQPSRRRRQQ